MSSTRILVAGVGNVLLSDDGFGVEVVRRLALEPMPEGVHVVDYGIRALHLAYELLEGYDTLVIVDAMSRGEPPGTVFVFSPDLDRLDEPGDGDGGPALDPHGMHPAAVLRMAVGLGARLGVVRVVGCEPENLEEEMGLSAPVERAVGEAVRIVRELVGGGRAVSKKEDDHVEEQASQSQS
jgi:hydrogenase maturation protease